MNPVMVVKEQLVEECTLVTSRVQQLFARINQASQADGRYVSLNPPRVLPVCVGFISKVLQSLSLVEDRLEVEYPAIVVIRERAGRDFTAACGFCPVREVGETVHPTVEACSPSASRHLILSHRDRKSTYAAIPEPLYGDRGDEKTPSRPFRVSLSNFLSQLQFTVRTKNPILSERGAMT